MPSSGRKSAANPTSQKNVDVAEMRAETLGNEKIFQEAVAQEIEDRVNDIDDYIFRPSLSSKKSRVELPCFELLQYWYSRKQNKESHLVR